jgi:site-specific DNA recombinase
MRTASYARYSSENQRETSIEDQLRLTDERAAREGWSISLRYTDMEISASTPTLFRAGGRALIETVRARRIDVLLIESLDRCWRDIVDQEITIRDIERLGVRIIGISDGYDSLREGRELQRVIIGGVNQQYLRDLGKKVHRGLTGQTERGYHAGGLGYGYRTTVAGLDAKGEPIGHRLEIDEERAQWVRWIFERHTEGWAPRRIVYELNRTSGTDRNGPRITKPANVSATNDRCTSGASRNCRRCALSTRICGRPCRYALPATSDRLPESRNAHCYPAFCAAGTAMRQ